MPACAPAERLGEEVCDGSTLDSVVWVGLVFMFGVVDVDKVGTKAGDV